MLNSDLRHRAANVVDRAYQLMSAQDLISYSAFRNLYVTAIEWLLMEMGEGGLQGKRVLDVGAGRGTLSLAMHFLGAEVTALEKYAFEHSTSEMFREGGEKELLEVWQAHGITPLVEDLFAMDSVIPPASFDAVVALEVIEHVKIPKRMLDQIYRALKPNGAVIITTPNYGRLHARLRLLFGQNPKLDLKLFYSLGEDGFIGHWREYLPSELDEMLRLANFVHTYVITFCDPWQAISKRVSFYTIKQTLLHLLSYLVPRGRYGMLGVGRKAQTPVIS